MTDVSDLVNKKIIATVIANKSTNTNLLKDCIYETLINRGENKEDISFLIKYNKEAFDPKNIHLLESPKLSSFIETQLTGSFKKITKFSKQYNPIITDLINFKREYNISSDLPLKIYYTILKIYESGSNIFLPYKKNITEKIKLPYKILAMYISIKEKNPKINLSDLLQDLNIKPDMYFNYALKNLIYMFPEYEDLFKNNYDKVILDLIGEDLANFQYDVININSLIKLPNENKNLIHLASICYVLIEKYNNREKDILTIISSLENIPKNSLQTIYKKIKNNNELRSYLISSSF